MSMKGGIVFLIFLFLLRHLVYGCEEDVPVLHVLDLRTSDTESDYWDGGDDIVVNDADIESRWYRVVLNGWQYIMTDVSSTPDFFKCSTYWPIYLREKHIPESNIGENPTDVIACIRDEDRPCGMKYTIQVRKCIDEIQYKLKPTAWLSAYCFDKAHKIQNRTTRPAAPENVEFGTITVEPKLDFEEETDKYNKTWDTPYIKFFCNFNKTDLFYTITWYADEIPIYTTITSTNSTDLVLHEKNLTSKKIPLGIYIRCGVRASTAVDGIRTLEKSSKRFYAGIQIAETNIYLKKNSSAVLQMKSTIPIGCKKRVNVTRRLTCTTEMTLFVDNDKRLQCDEMKGSVLNWLEEDPVNQMCAGRIQTLAKGDAFDPTVQYNFTIVTADDNYEDDDKYILQLQFSKTIGHTIWKDYYFPRIRVFVQNTTEYKKRICTARSDPHMITADGYHYDHHVEGIYLLYNNTKFNIEVQLLIKGCYWSSYPKCTCGIAISAGQDVFMINRCKTPQFLGFTQCGDGGILDVNRTHDRLFNVFTPIGSKIRIELGSVSTWMNVDITMAPKDMGNVYGLCGRVDGNRTNDLTHKDRNDVTPLGTKRYNNIHPDFSESWRIDENSEENLFRSATRTLKPWSTQNRVYCVCDFDKDHRNKVLCSPSQYLDCKKTGSITKTKCHIKGRRKRSVGNTSSKEIQRILSKMSVHFNSRQKRETVNEVIISEDARSFCKRKISGIPALTDFTDVGSTDDEETAISHCEFDLSATNDTSWSDVIVETVNNGVKNMLDLQPTVVKNNTEKVATFFLQTCPMNCSNRGDCVEQGVCSCYEHYMGSDCSIDERDGLIIQDIDGGGECDLADGEECECFYVRSDNIQDNFTCNVNTSKVKIQGDVEFVSFNALTGGYEDIFTGICCAPKSITGQVDVFVAQYTVSISNNGLHFGNAENVYVFHSKCQNISAIKDGVRSFTLKEKTCFIDGYCFSDNEMAPTGCRSCQSSNDSYNWTDYNPCQNGGSCLGDDVGYTCNCTPGYHGYNCEMEIDECLSSPCQNNGNCTDLFNKYSCDCVVGFIGENCQINVDECVSNPCENDAQCVDGINMYHCNCSAGYNGTHCEHDINECYSDPCQNGATCQDLIANYTCECAPGYEGTTCNIDINECDSNPCQNNGTCNDEVNGFKCTCVDGFTGPDCGVDIDECTSDPCQNGATCNVGYNSYTCECADGYVGQNCETDINECQSNPCINGGTCNDLANGFECTCVPGYNGTICDNDIDECSSDPCQNNGTCTDKVNEYECSCVDGFNGTNCEIDIDECQSNRCKNGGTCEDLVNGYECACVPGYSGTFCENDIDECSSSPCQNNGTCMDKVNGYECLCVAGFNGTNCNNDINDCESNPCKNKGTCTDLVNGFDCTCVLGYDGELCENDINECLSNPCKNEGTCNDLVNGYECICVPGYDGVLCENDIDECSTDPCQNNGTCTDKVNQYECSCVAGFNGSNCDIDIDECSSNPCQNNGTCTDKVNEYECSCVAGFNGANCDIDIDECSSSPCQNSGTCTDKVNEYECYCVAGYNGTSCDNDIDECLSNPCQNNGTCTDKVNEYECSCVVGFGETNCDINIDECSSNPCQNNGTCTDRINEFECSCVAGFGGTNCDIDIDECLSNPCQNNGTCTDKVNEYKCSCVAGFEGTNCNIDIDECSSNPCQNNGTCTEKVNEYECSCVAGFVGTNCNIDIDDCSSNPCKNNGICTDKVNEFECSCVAGFVGVNCDIDINECQSNPCINGGTCNDLVNGFECACDPGYDGILCDNDVDECLSNPCQNNGTCTDKVNEYKCSCVIGFDGTNCDIDINECQSGPCINGGTCNDLVNGFECTCVPGYDGPLCNKDIDECSSNPCQNDGTCMDKVNEYECSCDAGFDGTNCDNDINECQSNPCINGGTCKDFVNGFECTCVPGYDGALCDNDVNECVKYPCENNGTCHDKINGRVCHCADGYEGIDCETNIDDCETNPCLNGGTCEDSVNGYTCTCITGYDGANCDIVFTSTMGSIVSKLTRTPVTVVLQVKPKLVITDPKLKEDVTHQLTKFYKTSMGDKFKEVVVLNLRVGSLLVDFEVVYVDDSAATDDLTNANLDLVSGEKTIDVLNETVKASSVTIGEVTVSNATLADDDNVCAFYTTLNRDCNGHFQCSVLDGRPTCVAKSTESTDDLTLMLVVCSSVAAIIILAVVHICLYIKLKGKTLRNFRGKYNIGCEGTGRRKTSISYDVYESSSVGVVSLKPISNQTEFNNSSGPTVKTDEIITNTQSEKEKEINVKE